ncbi:hypothetical protein SE17_36635 [Kouleothrix aurantiaca]|uniref:Uncharacterized protein n=1 Tax=Kouleothrix aurantiaca TaxID=186479 RepID=A0A0P9CZY9_9CHLR|nr:hypothetical protein SE17_36635 [Kouleothrix aurantiaca]
MQFIPLLSVLSKCGIRSEFEQTTNTGIIRGLERSRASGGLERLKAAVVTLPFEPAFDAPFADLKGGDHLASFHPSLERIEHALS